MTESTELLTDQLARKLGDNASTLDDEFSKLRTWMLEKGKEPEKNEGLSQNTVDNYIPRLDQLFRLNIKFHDPKTQYEISHDQADQLINLLNEDGILKNTGEPYQDDAKRKLSNALEKYFLWRFDTGRDDEQWVPRITFSQTEYDSPDKLSLDERYEIREVAKSYGSVPSYYSADDDEKDRINGLIAQRLGKPKEEVTVKDWDRADQSSKVGSLVLTTLDIGLAPIEIEKFSVNWPDLKNNVVEIPSEYAAKDREGNKLPIDDDTAEYLSKWRKERRTYKKYDRTDRLWLNKDGNSYTSDNLCYLLRRLCDEAGIDYESRDIVWYSLRHNLGQYVSAVGSLHQAKDQLRHSTLEMAEQTYSTTIPEIRMGTLKKVNEAARRSAVDPEFEPFDEDGELNLNEDFDDSQHESEPSTSPQSGSRSEPSGGHKHIDRRFEDTPEGRMEVVQEIVDISTSVD